MVFSASHCSVFSLLRNTMSSDFHVWVTFDLSSIPQSLPSQPSLAWTNLQSPSQWLHCLHQIRCSIFSAHLLKWLRQGCLRGIYGYHLCNIKLTALILPLRSLGFHLSCVHFLKYILFCPQTLPSGPHTWNCLLAASLPFLMVLFPSVVHVPCYTASVALLADNLVFKGNAFSVSPSANPQYWLVNIHYTFTYGLAPV